MKFIDCITLEQKILYYVSGIIKNSKITQPPTLCILVVGNNPVSQIYVNRKITIAKEIGFNTLLVNIPENTNEKEVIRKIEEINNASDIHGLIVQLPLPQHLTRENIIRTILPSKDVDGLNPWNVGLLNTSTNPPYSIKSIMQNNAQADTISNAIKLNKTPFIPCTPLGCMYVIEQEIGSSLIGKNAVVFGNSNLVGKPLSRLLMQEGVTVTTFHSKSTINANIVQNANVIILATGTRIVLPTNLKQNAIIIDVGIRLNEDGKIIGDADYANVVNSNINATPVPKGIGRLTVASLMFNTLLAWKSANQN